jgi:hypothetical protein
MGNNNRNPCGGFSYRQFVGRCCVCRGWRSLWAIEPLSLSVTTARLLSTTARGLLPAVILIQKYWEEIYGEETADYFYGSGDLEQPRSRQRIRSGLGAPPRGKCPAHGSGLRATPGGKCPPHMAAHSLGEWHGIRPWNPAGSLPLRRPLLSISQWPVVPGTELQWTMGYDS